MSRNKNYFTFFIVAIFFTTQVKANQCSVFLDSIINPPKLITIDSKTKKFSGLTEEGLLLLKTQRDILRNRFRIFDNEIKGLGTLHHAATVARLMKYHMFLYGPPGGAKSMFVNHMTEGEKWKAFKLQLHQMITEQAFIGGQDFEAAKRGNYVINSSESLASYTTALLDEIEKGNPAALSTLLSLLNERKVLVGGQEIAAKLETLYATSNSNLFEFFDQFLENGQGSTAPALLNRFHMKGFVYNWLSKDDQASLDERRIRKEYLTQIAKVDPSVLEDEVFLKPQPLDWESLRHISVVLFRQSTLFQYSYRDLVEEMRDATIEAIRNSEEDRANDPKSFAYFPSADYTERLRQQIPSMVMMSAFVDFLLSPLADDDQIEKMTSQSFELDSSSLWRAHLMMTTIGSGTAKLKVNVNYDPNQSSKVEIENTAESDLPENAVEEDSSVEGTADEQVQAAEVEPKEEPLNSTLLDIDFGWNIDPTSARDSREQAMIQNLMEEQDRFKSVYLEQIKKIQEELELGSQFDPKESIDKQDLPFELLLIKTRAN